MTGRTPAQVSRGLTTLGTHVRAWRLLTNLTQALIAERAGVSRATVAAIEASAAAHPSQRVVALWSFGRAAPCRGWAWPSSHTSRPWPKEALKVSTT